MQRAVYSIDGHCGVAVLGVAVFGPNCGISEADPSGRAGKGEVYFHDVGIAERKRMRRPSR